jgi:NADPH:quinone reductase-like Zn-dependent oxidoreductase
MAASALQSFFISKQGRPYYSPVRKQDLLDLTAMIEDGKIVPAIGRTFSLSEAAEAMAHVGSGHSRGKVAITI